MSVLTVGSGEQYSTISAAVAASSSGDTINVDAGTYTNDFPAQVNNLTIEGVGGQVNLVATQQPSNGKAILDVAGDATLKNLTFSGATVPDGNGAGVRYEGGTLTIEDCDFHDNQDGLLANGDPNGTVSIDSSEFYNNGTGDGHTHNIYILGINQFTLTNSYVHDANEGHEVKSRAENNTITGNRIYDNQSTSSYSIDLPDSGNADISSNTIEQGPNGGNPAIIAYGEESNLNAGSSVTLSNNTIVNDLTANQPLLLLNDGASVSGSGNTAYGLDASQLGSGVPASAFTFTSTRPTLDTSSPVTQQTPAPNPSPNPSPTPVPAPSSGDTLTLYLSEDAWQGDAQVWASLDGQQLASGQPVTASHAAGQSQAFTYTGNFGAGSHDLAISFLNDAWGGTPDTDRNLYVDGVTYDGNQVPNSSTALYSNGTVHFQIPALTGS